jgi:hypothetical protein
LLNRSDSFETAFPAGRLAGKAAADAAAARAIALRIRGYAPQRQMLGSESIASGLGLGLA